MNARFQSISSIFLFLVSLSLWIILGCGNNLTREKAFEILNINMPKITGIMLMNVDLESNSDDIKRINNLASEGMISYRKQKIFGDYERYGIIINLSKSKNYYLGGVRAELLPSAGHKVVLAERKLVAVTGIKMFNNNKEAEVDFNWKIDNISPFGKAVQHRRGVITMGSLIHEEMPIGSENTQYSGTAFMSLYDDGWRIEKVTLEGLTYTYKIQHRNMK
jgi:hypothetical protein